MTYETLDDPEYILGESGRIEWTVQGVNGTPEKPNKEKIMRSPSVLIGNHYWNIKYYPRGNDGTEQLSVYIECSTSPYEDRKTAEAAPTSSAAKSGENSELVAVLIDAENPPHIVPSITAPNGGQSLDISGQAFEPPPPPLAAEDSVPLIQAPVQAPVHWEVAAQVSCVIHNPAEPRVHVSQKSSHRYYHDNPDWGWTRFHGPWDEIHKRQRFQRQALLRNDTLTFTAYIRTIRDDTGTLWWHPPKEKPAWNSVARVGFKRLICGHFQSSALISAMSTWLFLSPIIDLVFLRIPNFQSRPKTRIKPLLSAFQQIVRETLGPVSRAGLPGEPTEASLANIANILEWYGENIYYSKMDVLATWETLRRILNSELSEMLDTADARDFLQDVVSLKQSNIRRSQRPFNEDLSPEEPTGAEPSSVLDTVQMAFAVDPETPVTMSKYPSVLQIELHRQRYSTGARRWKKLTHKIKIDETLTIDAPFSSRKLDYTLYGMIVHSGDLESNDYYSVVRPGGPESFWVKYASDRDRKGVTRLTRKQAITNHEGKGESSEGTAAVAYVVLYVRTDCWSNILASGPGSVLGLAEPALESAPESTAGKEVEKKVSVKIYQSDLFKAHTGRGILDPRVLQSSPTLELEFAASKTLADVEEYFREQYANAGKQEYFRLWALDIDIQRTVRGLPRLESGLAGSYPLDVLTKDLALDFGGCHFWLHVIPADEAAEMRKQYEIVEESTCTPTSGETAAVVEAGSSDQSRPDAAIQEQDASISEHAEAPAVSTSGNVDQANSQVDRTPSDEDTIMDEAHDLGTREAPIPPAAVDPFSSWISDTGRQPKPHTERMYLLIKIFDSQNQTLRGAGGFFAKRDEKIGEVVRRVLLLGPEEAFDIFQEKSLQIKDKHRVKTSTSFTDNVLDDGCILIIQRRPSESE